MAESPEDSLMARGSLTGSEEVLVAPAGPVGPAGGSNKRAFKVAALTTLACLLLASQVFTAFMVFDQKQQIHTLQKNSDKMSKQLTRSHQAVAPVRMSMPMSNLPLLMDYTTAEDSKTPLTKLEDTAIVSVEKQLKDLLQNSQLPQFNQTFLANLQSMEKQMNQSDWKSFETWMRHWLIFQMAQQKPAPPPTQPAPLTKCQEEAKKETGKFGSYKPQCDSDGRYMPIQCWHATGFCWCVDETGTIIQGTEQRGRPQCPGSNLRRRLLPPRMMQKTISLEA